jgi:hypothetical protein
MRLMRRRRRRRRRGNMMIDDYNRADHDHDAGRGPEEPLMPLASPPDNLEVAFYSVRLSLRLPTDAPYIWPAFHSELAQMGPLPAVHRAKAKGQSQSREQLCLLSGSSASQASQRAVG